MAMTHNESFYRHAVEPVVGLLVAYACVALLGFGLAIPAQLRFGVQKGNLA